MPNSLEIIAEPGTPTIITHRVVDAPRELVWEAFKTMVTSTLRDRLAGGRGKAMGVKIVLPTHRNPPSGDGGPNHWECGLRDPDGYMVVLAGPDGSAG